jgi:hypothetical protein
MKHALANSSGDQPQISHSVREILENQKNKRRISPPDARLPPRTPQSPSDQCEDSEEDGLKGG